MIEAAAWGVTAEGDYAITTHQPFRNEQPSSKLRGIEQQEPKANAASGGEYDPK
jgi:hypothetical protein